MSKGEKTHKTKTIVGYVDMVDEDDRNAGIVISTEDEEYIVEMDKAGKRLMNEIGEKVYVTGAISEDDEYDYRIMVSKFEVIEYEEEYEEDEDDYRFDD